MTQKLAALFRLAKAGKRATVPFEIDGKTYLRVFRSGERLILLGAGHIAQPLCRYAADLGFSVTVVDDRPDYANHTDFPEADAVVCNAFSDAIPNLKLTEQDAVAVITRGHRYDAECLRAILSGNTLPGYIGMIGSRRRAAGLLRFLEQEGYPAELLRQIHAPIGLEIHAQTTKEIAISIVAELIQHRREPSVIPSGNTLLVMDDVDWRLLEFLSRDVPKAILLVYETAGSTPVKSGALMAVDQDFRTAGTIGGGCSEAAVLRDARRIIGTGTRRCVGIDLSNDLAAEEGMVCGGKMKVLMQDLPVFRYGTICEEEQC